MGTHLLCCNSPEPVGESWLVHFLHSHTRQRSPKEDWRRCSIFSRWSLDLTGLRSPTRLFWMKPCSCRGDDALSTSLEEKEQPVLCWLQCASADPRSSSDPSRADEHSVGGWWASRNTKQRLFRSLIAVSQYLWSDQWLVRVDRSHAPARCLGRCGHGLTQSNTPQTTWEMGTDIVFGSTQRLGFHGYGGPRAPLATRDTLKIAPWKIDWRFAGSTRRLPFVALQTRERFSPWRAQYLLAQVCSRSSLVFMRFIMVQTVSKRSSKNAYSDGPPSTRLEQRWVCLEWRIFWHPLHRNQNETTRNFAACSGS